MKDQEHPTNRDKEASLYTMGPVRLENCLSCCNTQEFYLRQRCACDSGLGFGKSDKKL